VQKLSPANIHAGLIAGVGAESPRVTYKTLRHATKWCGCVKYGTLYVGKKKTHLPSHVRAVWLQTASTHARFAAVGRRPAASAAPRTGARPAGTPPVSGNRWLRPAAAWNYANHQYISAKIRDSGSATSVYGTNLIWGPQRHYLVAPGRVQPPRSDWMAGGLANYRNGHEKFADV
jgi:hypothetical protein